MMRSIFAVGYLLLGLMFATPPARAADNVTVQLDWVVRGNHAMFFVAKAKGYFADNGIDVTAIRKGTGSVDALRLVANGNADFGFADLPTLVVGRSQGIPVVALVAVNQESPLAMISLAKSKPLKTVADLKGLNIGVHPAGSTYVFLKALLAANGMSIADIKQSTVSPPYENYLILGRVDAVPGYLDAEVPELEAKAGGAGSLSILQGSDFGWIAYGSGMFTSSKMIADKPDLVQRFTAAYARAFKDVVEHPDEAVQIVVQANPEYQDKSGVLREQLEADIKHTFFSADTKANGIGHIDPNTWATMIKTLHDQGELPAEAKTDGAYEDRFIAGAQPLRQ